MKNLCKIILVAFIAVASWDEVVANDNHNALFGVDTSKEMIAFSDTIQGKFGENGKKSVCEKLSKTDIYPEINNKYGDWAVMGEFFYNNNSYSIEQLENLLGLQIYYMDIKRDDKENVCTYVMTTDKSYMDTQITQQELARFEKFLFEHEIYESYDTNNESRESYIAALKFFKYHNKIEVFYAKTTLEKLNEFIRALQILNDKSDECSPIAIYSFLYGKAQTADIRSAYKEVRSDCLLNTMSQDNRLMYCSLPTQIIKKAPAGTIAAEMRKLDCNAEASKCEQYTKELRTIIHFVADKLHYKLDYD